MDRDRNIKGLNDEIERLNHLIEQGGASQGELQQQLAETQKRLADANNEITRLQQEL